MADRREQSTSDDAAQAAFIQLLVAAGHVRQRLNEVSAGYGITHDQYNVLRILRGVHPEGHPRYEIVNRLIERSPDVTRLLDRLVRDGLVERYRSEEDRRLSIARITPKGLALLADMEDDIRDVREHYMQAMNEQECRTFTKLCRKIHRKA